MLFGSTQPGSPFTVGGPGSWFFAGAVGLPVPVDRRFLGIMLVYVGLALLLGAWVEIVRAVRGHPGPFPPALVVVPVVWAGPLVLAPPLFSGDVYSYAAQGQMVTRGISPYRHGPAALGGGPFLRLVDPLWRRSPAPYGPAWERLSGAIVQAAHHDVLATLVGFRVVAVVGVTLLAVALPALARSVGKDPAPAFALGVLNPLVLVVLVGGAHNDALMLGLLAAGLAVARARRPGPAPVAGGLVLCALAAEVKIPALIGAVFIGWWWAGPGQEAPASVRTRLLRVVVAVGATGAVMAVIAGLCDLGWRWTTGLSNPGAVVSWLAPATALGLALSHAAGALGAGHHQAGWVAGARGAGVAGAALLSVRLLLRSDRDGPLTALGWSLLAFVVLGPVVWPWYETWGLIFLAVAATGAVVPVIIIVSAVACVADVPSPRLLITGDPALVAGAWILVAGAVGLSLGWRRPGRRRPGRRRPGWPRGDREGQLVSGPRP